MVRRAALASVVIIFVAATASADVTLKQKSGGKMTMGGNAAGTGAHYIKGSRMRVDEAMTGNPTATILDVNARQLIVLDEKRRQADVYDMAKLAAQVEKVASADVQARLTPTTQTRKIAGATCTVHNQHVSVPTAVAGEQIKVVISGPVCLSKDAPGQAEFAAFYKAAIDKGMFLGDPRTAGAQPGHAKGIARLYREMAAVGVPLAQEMNIKFEGSGPMGGMMSKVGGSTMTTEVVSISTDPIPDSMFEIPAGYKINKR